MKKKTRKQSKQKHSVRHEDRAVRSTPRRKTKKRNINSASSPWLQIVSSPVEDKPNRDLSWGYLSQHNGKRQPGDVDLYVPEHKVRTR